MTVLEFIKADLPRCLFPLSSPAVFTEHGEPALRTFVFSGIFAGTAVHFAQTPVAYAQKDKLHLRKLLVLDPIGTFYLYDFCIRNTSAFQKVRVSGRTGYGYAFHGNTPLPT